MWIIGFRDEVRKYGCAWVYGWAEEIMCVSEGPNSCEPKLELKLVCSYVLIYINIYK